MRNHISKYVIMGVFSILLIAGCSPSKQTAQNGNPSRSSSSNNSDEITGHVATNIGGVYQSRKTSDQDGVLYSPVPKDYQQKAMQFLNEHVFTTPEWLLDTEILRRIEHAGALDRVENLQSRILNSVMSAGVLMRLNEYHIFGNENYAPLEMLEELRSGVWSEIYNNTAVDPFRRNLQRIYLNNIEEFFTNDTMRSGRSVIDVQKSDTRPLLRVELNELKDEIEGARINDRLTQAHLDDVLERIEQILNPRN